jgi:hypothetical protein
MATESAPLLLRRIVGDLEEGEQQAIALKPLVVELD